MEPTKIPRFIDDPPILLIWTAHDLVIVVAMMLLGIFIDHLLYCLIASYFVIKFIRRFTDNRPNGFWYTQLIGSVYSQPTRYRSLTPISGSTTNEAECIFTVVGFVQAENRLHRILLIGLLATNVITAFAALRTERTVIMIPPNLTEKVEISRQEASAQTKEAWVYF